MPLQRADLCAFFSSLCSFILRRSFFSCDTAPTRRDVGQWGYAKGRGHLSATRMSFIVQIFSLLYSYWYIVTLRNVDRDGGRYAPPYHYCTFWFFLLNKCEHAEREYVTPVHFAPFTLLYHIYIHFSSCSNAELASLASQVSFYWFIYRSFKNINQRGTKVLLLFVLFR